MIGIAEGQGVVALGIAAAPLVSLMVVPWALRGRDPAPPPDDVETPGGLGSHTRFAGRRAGDHGRRAGAAQRAGGDRGRHRHRRRAGRLRVQRAAHHARAAAALPGDPDLAAPAPVGAGRDRQRRRLPPRAAHHDPRHRRLRRRSGDRAGRDRAVGDGPPVRRRTSSTSASASSWWASGWASTSTAGTLNQAALARDRAGLAAATWLGCAALFLLWLYGTPLDDQLLAVEAGYCATTALLCGVLVADRAARVDFASWPRPSTTSWRPCTPSTCLTASGRPYDAIPQMASLDPDGFGICLATVDGYLYEVGDTRRDFTIQSISKVFTYGLALADRGIEAVGELIDVEPSGEALPRDLRSHPTTGRPAQRDDQRGRDRRRRAHRRATRPRSASSASARTFSQCANRDLEMAAGHLRGRLRDRPPPPRDRPPAARRRGDRRRPGPGRRALLPPVRAPGRLPRPRADGRHAGQRRRPAADRRARVRARRRRARAAA